MVEDETGVKVRMGIDMASTELWDGEHYVYRDKKLTKEEQISYVAELVDKYDLLYVEDPLHEEDFEGFAELTEQIGKKCMICGDDLFVTNVKRIQKGIELKAGNTVLIKPNQVGTLTDTFKAVKLAKDNGYRVVVSHRSGETEDETIAHLSVAFNAVLIKTGVVGGERIAKLNELIRIEEDGLTSDNSFSSKFIFIKLLSATESFPKARASSRFIRCFHCIINSCSTNSTKSSTN